MSCAVATEAQHAAARAAIILPIGDPNPNDLVMDSSSNASRGSSIVRPHSTAVRNEDAVTRAFSGAGTGMKHGRPPSSGTPRTNLNFDAHGTDFRSFPEAGN